MNIIRFGLDLAKTSFAVCGVDGVRVEEAVTLGADAVGYTLYVGSPRQDEDLAQLRQLDDEVRQ